MSLPSRDRVGPRVADEASRRRQLAYREIKDNRDDPALLVAAAIDGGDRQRRYLRRRVFGPLHGRAPAFDAIYVGLTLSDAARRTDHLDRVNVAIAAGDDRALRALVDEATWWRLPGGFLLEKPFIGAGKTSRVALARRLSDGSQYAWKIPENDGEASAKELLDVAARSREWARMGATIEPAIVADDGRTVLQRYVEGTTLHKVLRGISEGGGGERSAARGPAGDPHPVDLAGRTALVALFVAMARGRAFVSGLNPRNLIYDGERWHVIDSGSVQRTTGTIEAFSLQHRSAREQWTRWTPDAGALADAVFANVRAELGLGWLTSPHAMFIRAGRVLLRRRRERV